MAELEKLMTENIDRNKRCNILITENMKKIDVLNRKIADINIEKEKQNAVIERLQSYIDLTTQESDVITLKEQLRTEQKRVKILDKIIQAANEDLRSLQKLKIDFHLLENQLNRCRRCCDKEGSICKLREPETQWKGRRYVNVLCCDGGGIKGIATIEMLLKIFSDIKKMDVEGDGVMREMCVLPESGYAPHQVFDLICGTSTGSFIAYALAIGRISLIELRNMYTTLAGSVFSSQTKRRVVEYLGSPSIEKWDSAKLREQIVRFTQIPPGIERTEETIDPVLFSPQIEPNLIENGKVNYNMMEDPRKIPLFFCTAKDVSKKIPKDVLMTNYAHINGYQMYGTEEYSYFITSKMNCWQALRASSAAPTFFTPFVMNSEIQKALDQEWIRLKLPKNLPDVSTSVLIDGGIGQNNPSYVGYTEAARIFGPKNIGLILSIGVGNNPKDVENADAKWFIKNMGQYEIVDGVSVPIGVYSLMYTKQRAKALLSVIQSVIATATETRIVTGTMSEIEKVIPNMKYRRINFDYTRSMEMDNPSLIKEISDYAKQYSDTNYDILFKPIQELLNQS